MWKEKDLQVFFNSKEIQADDTRYEDIKAHYVIFASKFHKK